MRSYSKALPGGMFRTLVAMLLLPSFLPAPAFAQDNGQGLSGSNFGSVLPQSNFAPGVFKARTPLSDALSSPQSSSGPNLADADFSAAPQGASAASDSNSSASSLVDTSVGLDRPNAWFKFLDPSLNLSRALEDSERKRILSVVPMPPNLTGDPRKTDKRTTLLRADASSDYACLKTVCGSLFGRSNALILVFSGKVLRVLNLSGREKDVLFKLHNGQVITVGPGSEMMIAHSLDAHDLVPPDGISRRGITRTMRCSDLQMAFAQFSYPSVFELAELKFFIKNQNPKYLEALRDTVAKLNEIRGTNGFKQAVVDQAQHNKEARPVVTRHIEVRSVAPQKQAEAKTELRPALKSAFAGADTRAKAKDKDNEKKLARATKELESDRKKTQELTKESKSADNKSGSDLLKFKPAKKPSQTASLPQNKAEEKSKSKDKGILSFGGKIKESIQAKVTEAKASKPTTIRSITSSSGSLERLSAPRRLMPRQLPGPDTPPEIAKLLLEADAEDRNAAALRKKADKCIAFMEGGLMNAQQQAKMAAEAKRHLSAANEAEERAQAIRKQVELAGKGVKPAM